MRTLILWMTMLGVMLTGGMLEGMHINTFIQPNAAIIVFGPLMAYLLINLGLKETAQLCTRIFQNRLEGSDSGLLDRVMSLGYLTGAVSAIFGLIHVLSNLSDSSKIGMGIAVTFVGVLYGTLPALLITSLSVHTPPPVQLREKARNYMVASVLVLLFSFFVVLYALGNTNGHPTTKQTLNTQAGYVERCG